MQLTRLLTYSFEKNVGNADRILRVALGAALAALPWLITLPQGFRYGLVTVGVMIFVTGVLSRCGLYYLIGFRTCPISGKPNPSINR